jgi:hypothetical protein
VKGTYYLLSLYLIEFMRGILFSISRLSGARSRGAESRSMYVKVFREESLASQRVYGVVQVHILWRPLLHLSLATPARVGEMAFLADLLKDRLAGVRCLYWLCWLVPGRKEHEKEGSAGKREKRGQCRRLFGVPPSLCDYHVLLLLLLSLRRS